MGYHRRGDPDAWWQEGPDTPEFAGLARTTTWVGRWLGFARLLMAGVGLLGLGAWVWVSLSPPPKSERTRQIQTDGRDAMTTMFVAGGALYLVLAAGVLWWLVRTRRGERDVRWG